MGMSKGKGKRQPKQMTYRRDMEIQAGSLTEQAERRRVEREADAVGGMERIYMLECQNAIESIRRNAPAYIFLDSPGGMVEEGHGIMEEANRQLFERDVEVSLYQAAAYGHHKPETNRVFNYPSYQTPNGYGLTYDPVLGIRYSKV